MAVESKPLFHPEVIRQHLRNFVLPASVEDSRPRLKHWADLISSGQADKLKETDLLPDFLTDIFVTLLDYTRPAESPDCYTLSRETHVVVDGQKADAVLGRFLPDKQEYIVAIEGKGTRDPLEIPFGGRKMSAGKTGVRKTGVRQQILTVKAGVRQQILTGISSSCLDGSLGLF